MRPRNAAVLVAASWILAVIVFGVIERIADPHTFPSVWLAFWWAIQTVTTVGYGDVVPQDPWGRVVGSLLMLTGLSLIPTLTSVIVSTLISKRTRAQTKQFEDELVKATASLHRIEERLGRMESGSPSSPEPV
jgi:voltage-gated potassium channel